MRFENRPWAALAVLTAIAFGGVRAQSDCEDYTLAGVRPGMSLGEVRKALDAKAGLTVFDHADGPRSLLHHQLGTEQIFVEFDAVVRKSADGSVAVVRQRTPAVPAAYAERTGSAVPARAEIAECGYRIRVREVEPDWWSPGSEATPTFEVELASSEAAPAQTPAVAAAIPAERVAEKIPVATPTVANGAPAAERDELASTVRPVDPPRLTGRNRDEVPEAGYVGPALVRGGPPRLTAFQRRYATDQWVKLGLLVAKDGTVFEVDVVTTSGGQQDLTDKAVAAARSWRYRPAYQDGEPIESYVAVTVRFD